MKYVDRVSLHMYTMTVISMLCCIISWSIFTPAYIIVIETIKVECQNLQPVLIVTSSPAITADGLSKYFFTGSIHFMDLIAILLQNLCFPFPFLKGFIIHL